MPPRDDIFTRVESFLAQARHDRAMRRLEAHARMAPSSTTSEDAGAARGTPAGS